MCQSFTAIGVGIELGDLALNKETSRAKHTPSGTDVPAAYLGLSDVVSVLHLYEFDVGLTNRL